jgi:hypothetical protein
VKKLRQVPLADVLPVQPGKCYITISPGPWDSLLAAACGFHGDVFDVQAQASGKPVADVLREQCGPPKRSADPGKKNLQIFPTLRPADPEKKNLQIFPTLDALQAAYPGCEAAYVYGHPETGRPEMVVLRIREGEKKSFRQARPEGDGFVLMAPAKPWPLYNRRRVCAATTVIVVEGEKCVHALTDVLPEGLAATTSPGGAGNGHHADWSPLAGKRVYLWPDWDEPGRKHMAAVADTLSRLDPPAELWLLDADTLNLSNPGDDVVEYLDLYGGETPDSKRDALDVALARAEPLSPSADLHRRIEATIAGRYAAVGWPWPMLGHLTQALRPGTVTLVCGSAGATKSFFVLQAVQHWLASGVKVALYELEEDRESWLTRVLALLEADGRLTDTAIPDGRRDLGDGPKGLPRQRRPQAYG